MTTASTTFDISGLSADDVIPADGPLLSPFASGWSGRTADGGNTVSASRGSVDPVTRARLAAGLPLVAGGGNRRLLYRIAKRCLDVTGSVALILLCSPLLLTILAVLTVTTGGRPLFVQTRVGYRGRCFRMLKFRTMRRDAEQVRAEVVNEMDGPIFKNRRDPRITRVGRFLRRTSLDELPQLFHVLAGRMSLVGPRPPIPTEVEQYQPWQLQRLSVPPGLTCLWQISGRSEIGFEEWVRMDLRYARRQGLVTDLQLLLKTPWSVLCGRGAY
jgi:lipopolysaccharide/colanic/teichoic acid biosynthesis glycosyltransferase